MSENLGESVNLEASEQKVVTEINGKSSSENYERISQVHNRTYKQVVVSEEIVWTGAPGTRYPDNKGPVAAETSRLCSHVSTLPPGIKFGRVYVEDESPLPTTRKYVVAFDTPAHKAYAESGPIGPVDWNVVEDRLSKSEARTEYVDRILGGKVVAFVKADGGGCIFLSCRRLIR